MPTIRLNIAAELLPRLTKDWVSCTGIKLEQLRDGTFDLHVTTITNAVAR